MFGNTNGKSGNESISFSERIKVLINILYLHLFINSNLFAETAMGVSIDALSQPNSDYVKAVKE